MLVNYIGPYEVEIDCDKNRDGVFAAISKAFPSVRADKRILYTSKLHIQYDFKPAVLRISVPSWNDLISHVDSDFFSEWVFRIAEVNEGVQNG